jgi:hypothetical protein
MAGKTVIVPEAVFEGICALRGHPELDPTRDLIECMEYLWRNEEYRPAADWIGANFQEFWLGWDGEFKKGFADVAKETVDA